MDALPQAPRPSLKPKVVALYEQLFRDFVAEEDDYFPFNEMFVLQPRPAELATILSPLDGNDFMSIHTTTQTFFKEGVKNLKSNDESKINNVLVTMRIFLYALLGRRYLNFSSDIILLLTGITSLDEVFGSFVSSLDRLISSDYSDLTRSNAVRLTLTVVCGAYQSSLLSYFMYNDIFTPLVTYIASSTSSLETLRASVLLALLSTYNKHESANPYQMRLRDFINEEVMNKIIDCVGRVSMNSRDTYTALQNDTVDGLLGGVTKMVTGYVPFGLASRLGLSGSNTPPVRVAGDIDEAFGRLPDPEIAVLLMSYEFSHANKAFSLAFIRAKGLLGGETPFGVFLSLTSYLTTQQSRSLRATLYSRLAILTIRHLIDDSSLMALLQHEDTKSKIRICRQRQPSLPLISKERKLVEGILDICVGGIDHNLRRRLDVELYDLFLTIISKVIHFNRRTRVRLVYHWNELWRSLLGLLKFLTSKADSDLKELNGIHELANTLVELLGASLAGGETFLPGTAEYDDLFYKLVQASTTLEAFSQTYFGKRPSSTMNTLLSVCKHYQELLSEHQKTSKSQHLSSKEVTQVIKQGYDSIQLTPASPQFAASIEGAGGRYKEAEYRAILKKIWRIAISDGSVLLERTDAV